MRVLLTGGAGYIGAHVAIELQQQGHEVVIADNFANSRRGTAARIERVTGIAPELFDIDVANRSQLDELFSVIRVEAVIHLAGHKSVEDSVRDPLEYYDNNLLSTLSLLSVMRRWSVRKMVFSSSATVYQEPTHPPISETSTVGLGQTSPYGRTKAMIEAILADFAGSDPLFEASILRYFNPVGAHMSGLIGEAPLGKPSNLLPLVGQAAMGQRAHVSVFGNSYDTLDGTGVRDYIHVVDLALGHVAALEGLARGVETFNLGTGTGHSVLDVIKAYERAAGRQVPYRLEASRNGDVARSFADVSKVKRELGWTASRTLDDSCRDDWRWRRGNADLD